MRIQSSHFGDKFVQISVSNSSPDPIPFVLQNGTTGVDTWGSILAHADGSVTLGGTSWGAWDATNFGSGDFAALKLDENGTEVYRWQVINPSCVSRLRQCTREVIRTYHDLNAHVRKGALLR